MKELARAKVNLSLHITGRRADGYHLLDSLVVFPDIADVLHLKDSGFSVSGPFSQGLSTTQNLVLEAARNAGATAGFHLEKNLPVSSGIGGGSADAAAAMRLLGQTSGKAALALGADVPACLVSKPLHMQGIGEQLRILPPLPGFAIVLVNAGVAVSTARVFARLSSVNNPAAPRIPALNTRDAVFAYVRALRNDMQAAALEICPEIATVLAALKAQTGCAVHRMSGSGGTCFGLFETLAEARAAQAALKRANPQWWVAAGSV